MIEIIIIIIKKNQSTQFAKQMSLTNNPDYVYFWDSFLVMTQSSLVELSCVRLRRVILA